MVQEGMSGQHHATAALYHREWTPGIHWIRCWVGLRSDLDTETEEKCFASVGDRTSIVQYVFRHYTDCATQILRVAWYYVKTHCKLQGETASAVCDGIHTGYRKVATEERVAVWSPTTSEIWHSIKLPKDRVSNRLHRQWKFPKQQYHNELACHTANASRTEKFDTAVKCPGRIRF
jgi:hypothetical protein